MSTAQNNLNTVVKLDSTAAGEGAAMLGRGLPVVDSIAGLRALLKTAVATRAFAVGYYVAGDGGGGAYWYDSSDTTSTDNGGTIIVATDGGRWKLVYSGMVSIRQFGCIPGQSRANNTTCMQSAVNWSVPIGHTLHAPEGVYQFGSPITKASSIYGVRMVGAGKQLTRFEYSTFTAGQALFVIIGGSGTLCSSAIEGIGFDGVTGASGTYGIEVRGLGGQSAKDCEFAANAVGFLAHNKDAGQFTEYCTADGCEFTGSCTVWFEYRKASGDRSFHGSGLKNRCLGNTAASGTQDLIVVGADCLPYNSPMDVQVWVNNTATLVKNNNTGSPTIHNPNWHGCITVESFGANVLTLATGYSRTFFLGQFSTINQNVNFGAMKFVKAFRANVDGSFDVIREDHDIVYAGIVTGAALDIGADFFPGGVTGAVLLQVSLIGANYRYSHTFVACLASGAGGSNTLAKLADLQAFNSAGWGPTTFGLDATGKLTITNASGGFNVTVYVGISQLGWKTPGIA